MDWRLWEMLVTAATCEILGDLAFKWWAETGRTIGLVGGLLVYTVALVLFAKMLRRAELAVVLTLWTGVALVLMALAGWWLFHETLSPRRVLGIALVIGGMVLLQM